MGCWYTGWGVNIPNGALVYGMGRSYTGWLYLFMGSGVSVRDGVLV